MINNLISPDHNGNRVTNIGAPVAATDATTKQYVDAAVSAVSAATGAVPIGAILMWSGTTSNIPTGYRLCNGANGTPNLTDRFIVGAGNTYTPATTGGVDTNTLATTNLPNHNHTVGDNGHSHGGSSLSVTGDGGHTHLINSNDGYHSHQTATDGNHQHGGYYRTGYTRTGSFQALVNQTTPPDGNQQYATQNDAAHSHFIPSSGNHTHALTGTGGHSHNISGSVGTNYTGISVSGGGQSTPTALDNRPRYYALCLIMRVS